jgi:hypothetical protein
MLENDIDEKIILNKNSQINIEDKPIRIFHKLIGKNKKFDIKLYEKYDIPVRNIIKEKLGQYIKDNENIYEQDMIILDENCKYKYLELQVCVKWTSNIFPYSVPYVYERKAKFSKDTLYMIFNRNMTELLLFDRESLAVRPRRKKKYARNYVYDIPWYRIIKLSVGNLNMDSINIY